LLRRQLGPQGCQFRLERLILRLERVDALRAGRLRLVLARLRVLQRFSQRGQLRRQFMSAGVSCAVLLQGLNPRSLRLLQTLSHRLGIAGVRKNLGVFIMDFRLRGQKLLLQCGGRGLQLARSLLLMAQLVDTAGIHARAFCNLSHCLFKFCLQAQSI